MDYDILETLQYPDSRHICISSHVKPLILLRYFRKTEYPANLLKIDLLIVEFLFISLAMLNFQ